MRNQLYESFLTEQGLTFSYLEKVALSQIDSTKSLRNQARLKMPLDKELVAQYEAGYRAGAGAAFPPLVISRPSPRSMYILADGNQRTAGARQAGLEFHDAYLVDVNDQMILDRLTWTINNRVNGKRLDPDECLEHAISYVKKYGVDAITAAAEWGLSRHLVQRKLRVMELKEILAKNKVKMAPSVPEPTIYALSPLIKVGEDIFVKAAKLTSGAGLTREDVEKLAGDIKQAPTSADKMAVIEKAAVSEAVKVRRAETKGGTQALRAPAPRDRLARLLRDVARVLDQYEKTALKPASHDYKEVRETASVVVRELSLLFGLGGDYREAKA